jgi:hypothetical protein
MRRLATWLLTRAVRVVRGIPPVRSRCRRGRGRPRFPRSLFFEVLEERDMPGDAVGGFFITALGLPPRAPLAPAEQVLGALADVLGMPPPATGSSRRYGAQALAASQADLAAGLWPSPLALSPGGALAGAAASAPGMSVRGEDAAAAPPLALAGDVLAADALARWWALGDGFTSPPPAGKGQQEPPAADNAPSKLAGASGPGAALAPVPGVSAALPAGVQVHIGPVAGPGLLGGFAQDAAPSAPLPALAAQAAAATPSGTGSPVPAGASTAAPVAVAGQNVLASPRPTPAELPLDFEANVGQVGDAAVQFLTHGPGYTLYLTATQAVFALRQPSAGPANLPPGRPLSHPTAGQTSPPPPAADLLTVQLVGANPGSVGAGQDPLRARSNYFLGNDPRLWHTNIPNYGKVEFPGVYPGVDLVYHNSADGKEAESDFVVAPGADPGVIRLVVQGAQSAQLDGQGDLVLTTAGGGRLVQQAPVLYQDGAGGRQAVAGAYVALGDGQFGFRVGSYDRSRPLVIDPVLTYSTYLGGSGDSYSGDAGQGIAVDSAGNTYVTGYTGSLDFNPQNPLPGHGTVEGPYNAFVAKFDPSGALVFSTYLGGTGNSYGYGDGGTGIAVDTAGNAYIAGYSYSSNFPTTQNAYQTMNRAYLPHAGANAFVAKLDTMGSTLLYSTYLGGSANAKWSDGADGIAVNPSSGVAYVSGSAGSSGADFPITAGAFQTTNLTYADNGFTGFVTELNATGTGLVYSTFLGGSGNPSLYPPTSYGDEVAGIALDAAGEASVTGYTYSSEQDFPLRNPIQGSNLGYANGAPTAFVARLNSTGTDLVYSTFLGGSGNGGHGDEGSGIALDAAGNAYVTGSTYSHDFRTLNPLQATNQSYSSGGFNAFVAEVNATGSALVYSTYLGGSGNVYSPYLDYVRSGIALDGAHDVYVTGFTSSTDFPTQVPVQGTYGGGGDDALVTELNATGSALVYNTYLGGSGSDYGYGIAVDGAGNAHVAGYTYSQDFPTQATPARAPPNSPPTPATPPAGPTPS